jgi:hypothetical protein
MFSGETWFQLIVCMNSQTNRFPVLIHKLLVHVADDDSEWFAMSAIKITVPISFCSHEFTSCYTHTNTIFWTFDSIWETYCPSFLLPPPPQQNNATGHTDNNSMHFDVYWLLTSSNIFHAIRNHINIAQQSFNYKIYKICSTAYHSECSISYHLLCQNYYQTCYPVTCPSDKKLHENTNLHSMLHTMTTYVL